MPYCNTCDYETTTCYACGGQACPECDTCAKGSNVARCAYAEETEEERRTSCDVYAELCDAETSLEKHQAVMVDSGMTNDLLCRQIERDLGNRVDSLRSELTQLDLADIAADDSRAAESFWDPDNVRREADNASSTEASRLWAQVRG
jgi:hypothetical protein